MPWKTLPIPIVIGMAAHAARWIVLQQGASLQTGAFIACLLVGLVVTPLADRVRMPFAAFAFASVVSLIPGVLLFQVAADLLALLQPEATMNVDLLLTAVRDTTTAFVIVLAMTLGLAIPKMGLGWLHIRRKPLILGLMRKFGVVPGKHHSRPQRYLRQVPAEGCSDPGFFMKWIFKSV